MQNIKSSHSYPRRIGFRTSYIWGGWLFGLVLGFIAATILREDLMDIMPKLMMSKVSAFDLIVCCMLPYIILLYAVEHSEPWLLPILCVVKAFFFGFCSFGIAFAFGSAGWLVRFFALFCDILTMPVLLCLCIRWGHRNHLKHAAVLAYPVYALCVIAVYCMDIAPSFRTLFA